ncbi:long-chain acyl-CoA synthetase [Winogradskyella epiphytica]|uniref:Long-chain acyl-CoA synthetase n=1 Tax=Winogradskyella epiphytica TaxID=262005 RepID=A0A2V4WTL0_9FLAO|nr:long-chain fatty acid--CoA ligase [Winogradskyella epiphytica]PYE80006.1 long-chain acyl-CoA synthetase [Winogradskyella epiphytica]GGW73121.1 AMP-dependent synthetase [Winogradskyella epiphytica]
MPKHLTRLFDLPEYQLRHTPQEKAFNTKVGGEWLALSTKEYCNQIAIISNALVELGVQADDKIAIVTEKNNVAWHILDMALLQVGAISVPLYATLSTKDYEFILNHSDSKLCFVSNKDLYDKVESVKANTQVSSIFCFNNSVCDTNWDYLLKSGQSVDHHLEVEKRKSNISTENLATIIYTSGTTGTPKGVMITHEALLFSIIVCSELLDLDEPYLPMVSYLPISHVFERLVMYYYQYMGFEIYFAESLEKLVDNLQEVKPVFLPIVPRLLEKIFDKIIAKGNELSGVKKALFFWAVRLAEQTEIDQKRGLKHKIADRLIFSKWRGIFGGNVKFLVSGSAPLQDRLIKVFTAAGLPVYEGYGMTESSGVISLNGHKKGDMRLKTVGKVLPGVEAKIAEDGEILIKGPNVLKGYYKDELKTAEAIKDGFLHTGDIGEICKDGFLKITDRKKEIFKTSGGKYIAPAIIENIMKQSSFIEQIMVIGEGYKMPAALIQVNYEFVKEWALRHNHEIIDITTDEKLLARIQ